MRYAKKVELNRYINMLIDKVSTSTLNTGNNDQDNQTLNTGNNNRDNFCNDKKTEIFYNTNKLSPFKADPEVD
ncbi:hypothetical protein Glove_363g29 [Diversispora epigaea]|uniref:Uncharacterized protein n=1 Tax=Diversispora epigaea TaxID=1348612 RepID=A0A397HD53_9GLOM|nr:hypothetical protein Glove_363g29 [Diversispora epigaea]